jgi:hypothetical protein
VSPYLLSALLRRCDLVQQGSSACETTTSTDHSDVTVIQEAVPDDESSLAEHRSRMGPLATQDVQASSGSGAAKYVCIYLQPLSIAPIVI